MRGKAALKARQKPPFEKGNRKAAKAGGSRAGPEKALGGFSKSDSKNDSINSSKSDSKNGSRNLSHNKTKTKNKTKTSPHPPRGLLPVRSV